MFEPLRLGFLEVDSLPVVPIPVDRLGPEQEAWEVPSPPDAGLKYNDFSQARGTRRPFDSSSWPGDTMKLYRVKSGSRLDLNSCDPDDTGAYKKNDDDKAAAKAETRQLIRKLSRLQERLYANKQRSLLIILQGMDTSGKDGTIRSVMSGVNPQGCRVF